MDTAPRQVDASPPAAAHPPWAFGLSLVSIALGFLAMSLGGAWHAVMPLYHFALVPVLDAALGLDRREAVPEAAGTARRDLRYDAWLWAWAAGQLALIGYGLARAEAGWALAGLATTSGIVGALGINAAHELMHRRGRPERALAEVLMVSVGYPHFCVEHVLGHHRNVATPEDPASARRGESLYAFLPRTVLGGLASAWRLETERVRASGARGLADRRLRYPLELAALVLGVAFAFGAPAVGFLAGHGLVAVVLLETINYVEHYGLSRRPLAPGRYEPCRAEHSWNSAHRLTNHVLFNLPRHADHHVSPRPYYALRDVPGPQLPYGYATMVLCAFAPPLYRRVMDPLVDAWQGGHPTAHGRGRDATA